MRKTLFKIGRIEVWTYTNRRAPLIEKQRWAWHEGNYLHKLFIKITLQRVLAISWYAGSWK